MSTYDPMKDPRGRLAIRLMRILCRVLGVPVADFDEQVRRLRGMTDAEREASMAQKIDEVRGRLKR